MGEPGEPGARSSFGICTLVPTQGKFWPRRINLMYSNTAYQGYAAPGRTATLFGHTMFLVALTAGFFAAGAYAGRNLSEGALLVAWIAAFVVLMIMNFAARKSPAAATALLVIFGVLMGVAPAPTLVWYATPDPAILWQAGGATALFVAGFGTFGYLTSK